MSRLAVAWFSNSNSPFHFASARVEQVDVHPVVAETWPLETIDDARIKAAWCEEVTDDIFITGSPRIPFTLVQGREEVLSCATLAFSNHLPLRLNLAVVWLANAQGFACLVRDRAEELRSRSVTHAGKETLNLTADVHRGACDVLG
jgi:hypothetical protein